MSRRAETAALVSLAALIAVTIAWWALALWPVPGGDPGWLERARWVCFGSVPGGLPDASGWLLLVGQPLGMLALLMAFAGGGLRSGVARLGESWPGRGALAGAAAVLLVGAGAAGVRVADVRQAGVVLAPGDEIPPSTYPRLDRPAPALGLVDQRGAVVEVSHFRGRSFLLTFAFGHCETLCPVVVHQAREAVAIASGSRGGAAARGDGVPAPPGPGAGSSVPLVVVTLDPWRDTPSRLPWIAEQWLLGPDDHVLSGGVDEVNAVLDAWGIVRERDPLSGDVSHPPLVYVVDGSGRIAFGAAGGPRTIAALLDRL